MAYGNTEAGRQTMARIKAGEGFLYVAAVIGTDIVKVGFSLDPEARMRTLRPFTGESMRLMGYFPCSLYAEEDLHRHLCEHTSEKHGNEFYPRSVFAEAA